MSCIKMAPTTKSRSVLFETIYTKIANENESKAISLYSYFNSESFVNSFGDWKKAYASGNAMNGRVDHNGEPRLISSDNGYHYVDKNGNKVSFPVSKKNLTNTFDSKTIKTISQYLGVEYLNSTRNISIADIDLDTEVSNVSLESFIKNAYDKRSKELEDSDDFEDMMTLDMLDDTRDIIDQWVPHVREFYRGISLNYDFSEDTDNANDTIEEETARDSAIGVNSFNQSSKKNVRTEVKIKLSMIKDNNGFEPVFGGNAYLPWDNAHEAIMTTISDNYIISDANGDIIDPAIEMMNRLEKLALKRPEFKQLIDGINSIKDEQQKDLVLTQFFQAFNLQRNTVLADSLKTKTHAVLEVDKNNPDVKRTLKVNGKDVTQTNVTSERRNITKSASSSKAIRTMWNAVFYDNLTKGEVGAKVTDVLARYKEYIAGLNNLVNSVGKESVESFDNNLIKRHEALQTSIMALIGDALDPRAVSDAIMKGRENYADNRARFLDFTQKLIKDLEAGEKVARDTTRKLEVDVVERSHSLGMLADAHAFYADAVSSATVFAGGKNVWLYSNKGYINTLVETWKKNPYALQDLYNSSPEQQSSLWLQQLLALDVKDEAVRPIESARRIAMLDSAILTDLFLDIENQPSESSDLSEASKTDFIINDFNKVVNSMVESAVKFVGGNYVRTTTPADKKTTLMLSVGRAIRSFAGFKTNGKIDIAQSTIDVFKGYVESDIRNAIKAKRELDTAMSMTVVDENGNTREKTAEEKQRDLNVLKIHYHYNAKSGLTVNRNQETDEITSITMSNPNVKGNIFSMQKFPELSAGYDFSKSEYADILKDIHNRLYNNGEVRKELVEGLIANPNLLTISEEGTPDAQLSELLNTYLSSILSDRIMATHERMIEDGLIQYTENKVTSTMLDNKTTDKVINGYKTVRIPGTRSFVFSTENTNEQLGFALATDYYINSVINEVEFSKIFTGNPAYYKNMIDFKKRVPATYTDGLTMRLKPGEENFNVAVIDGVEVKSPYLESLREAFGDAVASKYEEINSSDAQAWITPQRWEFIMRRLGKWSNTHQSFYDKMISGEDVTYTNAELKIASQPLKGVYFGLNKDGSPLYFKYSQAILTPRIVRNTPLQKVYDQMVKQGVDELITIDGVKVGSPVTSKIHDDNGDVSDYMYFNVIKADNLRWKLQQDLPTKTYKDTEIGSQIQKNIFAGLIHNPTEEFLVGDTIMTGQQVIDDIVREFEKLSNRGLESIFKEFGISTSSNPEERYRINNTERYYSALVDELKSRGGNKNIIDALEKQITIAGIPQARQKIDNMFASIVNKRIVKLKTNGGSFIQMSNFGLNFNEVTSNNSGILLHPDFMKLTQGIGKTMEPVKRIDEKTGREVITPGGIFISGAFLAKYLPNYRKYTPEQLFGYHTNKKVTKTRKVNKKVKDSENIDISNFINYSGNAEGSDKKWAELLFEKNVKTTNYVTSDYDKLSNERKQYVDNKYLEAVKALGRKPLDANSYSGKLVRRDFLQAESAETIFAVGTILKVGEKGEKGYINKAKTQTVDGGTGYAVQMALDMGKTVHVFNQADGNWYTASYNTDLLGNKVFDQFIKLNETPVINTNFAAIGTRGLKESGINAMKAVIEKSTNTKEIYEEVDEEYISEEGDFVPGMIDRRILEGLVGYRIPNQGLASNDSLQILGILPEENGDTIVAYTGITTKTGSDFD